MDVPPAAAVSPLLENDLLQRRGKVGHREKHLPGARHWGGPEDRGAGNCDPAPSRAGAPKLPLARPQPRAPLAQAAPVPVNDRLVGPRAAGIPGPAPHDPGGGAPRTDHVGKPGGRSRGAGEDPRSRGAPAASQRTPQFPCRQSGLPHEGVALRQVRAEVQAGPDRGRKPLAPGEAPAGRRLAAPPFQRFAVEHGVPAIVDLPAGIPGERVQVRGGDGAGRASPLRPNARRQPADHRRPGSSSPSSQRPAAAASTASGSSAASRFGSQEVIRIPAASSRRQRFHQATMLPRRSPATGSGSCRKAPFMGQPQ